MSTNLIAGAGLQNRGLTHWTVLQSAGARVRYAHDERPESISALPVPSQARGKHHLHRRDAVHSRRSVQSKTSNDKQRIPITLENSYYHIPLSLGTPAQEFSVALDTGSDELFIFGADAPGQFHVDNRHFFDPSKSSTFNPVDKLFDVSFGTEVGVHGSSGSDVLHIGTQSALDEPFGIVSRASKDWTWNHADGIIGMNYASTTYKHLFRNPATSLFTIKVSQDRGGEMTLGYIDPQSYIGQIDYAPVETDQGAWSWQVKTTRAKVNGKVYVRPTNLPACVLPDSGTVPNLLHDPALLAAIYSHIPGAMNTPEDGTGEWRVPTGSIYPTVEFEMNGVYHQIPTSRTDLAYTHRTDGMSSGLYQAFLEVQCDILGHTFFNSALLVFDVGRARLGIARRPDVVYDS